MDTSVSSPYTLEGKAIPQKLVLEEMLVINELSPKDDIISVKGFVAKR